MSDLEQKIREAAERLIASFRDERPDRELSLGESFNRSCATPLSYYCLASPANILALLAEKDAPLKEARAAAFREAIQIQCSRCRSKVPLIVDARGIRMHQYDTNDLRDCLAGAFHGLLAGKGE